MVRQQSRPDPDVSRRFLAKLQDYKYNHQNTACSSTHVRSNLLDTRYDVSSKYCRKNAASVR